MTILFQKMMFLHPYIIDAQPVGQLHLFQCFPEEPGLIPFLPGSWQLQVDKNAKFHVSVISFKVPAR
jgi:hypothetical protein